MDLTTAIIDNLISVEHSWENNAQYVFKPTLALTHEQIVALRSIFRMDYARIEKARNWGILNKFDVVIIHASFYVLETHSDEFNKMLRAINLRSYPTENNFDYYLDNCYVPVL